MLIGVTNLVQDSVSFLCLWYLVFLVLGYQHTNRRHWKPGTVKVCSYHPYHSQANNGQEELSQCIPSSLYVPASMGLVQLGYESEIDKRINFMSFDKS